MLAGHHRTQATEGTYNLIPIHASVIYHILWNSIEFYRMRLHKEKLHWLHYIVIEFSQNQDGFCEIYRITRKQKKFQHTPVGIELRAFDFDDRHANYLFA